MATLRVKRKAPQRGQYLPIDVTHAPTFVVGGLAHVWGMLQNCYFSWSAGVSCKTQSQMCGS